MESGHAAQVDNQHQKGYQNDHQLGFTTDLNAGKPASLQTPGSGQNGMYSRGTHNQYPFSPPRAGAGLPSSHSYQSGSTLFSPDGNGTVGPDGPGHRGLMSPENGRVGTFTEPRNYAPRTSGLPVTVTSEPPPKFDLGIAVATRHNEAVSLPAHSVPVPDGANAAADVNRTIGNKAVVPFIASEYAQSVEQVRAVRSEHLNRLTATVTGLPALEMALNPMNFPFIEGARQAIAINHGVVKLKNVSFL